MSVVKKTLAAVVAGLFPKSVQAVSESLNTEQFNLFAEDAEEVQNRLTAQQTGNEAVANDLTTAQARIQELEGQLSAEAAQSRITALEGELATVNASLAVFGATAEERTTYKATADLALKQADALRNAGVPPIEDASTSGASEAKSYEKAPWNGHLQTA